MPLNDNGSIYFNLVWDDFEKIPDYRVKIVNRVDYCTLKIYDEINSEDISWAFHPQSRGFKKIDRVRLAIEIIEGHLEYASNKGNIKEEFKEPQIITIKLESTQDMVDSKIVIYKHSNFAKVLFYDCATSIKIEFNADEKGIMKLNRLLAAIEIVNKEIYYIKNKAKNE